MQYKYGMVIADTPHSHNNRFAGEIIMLSRTKLVAALIASLIVSNSALASPLISIDNALTLPRCDDCNSGPVDIGFNINFFDNNYSQLYVNNNGNVSFNHGLSDYTFGSLVNRTNPIIAPFFSDIDTRNAGSPVSYGKTDYEGYTAFAVNWVDVDYFPSSGSHSERNSFQLVLVDRSDTGSGNFDFVFNYDALEWDNYSIWDTSFMGYGAEGNLYGRTTGFFKGFTPELALAMRQEFSPLPVLADSLFVDGQRNSDVAGRWVFEVRDGAVTNPLWHLTSPIPEPETYAMLLAGLGVVGAVVRRRRIKAATQAQPRKKPQSPTLHKVHV
jgi:hypothetical protein